jgi:hypothetical protein
VAWVRGLCRACYWKLAGLVRTGRASWAELVKTGQCRPAGKKRLPGFFMLKDKGHGT